jgi:hypothetical protein
MPPEEALSPNQVRDDSRTTFRTQRTFWAVLFFYL